MNQPSESFGQVELLSIRTELMAKTVNHSLIATQTTTVLIDSQTLDGLMEAGLMSYTTTDQVIH